MFYITERDNENNIAVEVARAVNNLDTLRNANEFYTNSLHVFIKQPTKTMLACLQMYHQNIKRSDSTSSRRKITYRLVNKGID